VRRVSWCVVVFVGGCGLASKFEGNSGSLFLGGSSQNLPPPSLFCFFVADH
jgi:hypothetical protein